MLLIGGHLSGRWSASHQAMLSVFYQSYPHEVLRGYGRAARGVHPTTAMCASLSLESNRADPASLHEGHHQLK